MEEKKRCHCCGGPAPMTRKDVETIFEVDGVDGGEDWRHAIQDSRNRNAANRKLASILARLKSLWASQETGRRVSRLDGGTIFSEAEWKALGESTLFARLREGFDEEGGGGASGQALPPSAAGSSDDRDGQTGERGLR